MKIAIVYNLPSGGAKRVIFELIRRLSENHDFYVYTYETANHDFADIRPFVKNYQVFSFKRSKLLKSPFGRINQLIRWIDLKRIQKLDRKIASLIEKENFDLVWVNPCQIQNNPSILRYFEKTPNIYICQEPLRILYEQMPDRPYDTKDNGLAILLNRIDPFPRLFFGSLQLNDRENIQSALKVLVNSSFMRDNVSKIYDVNPYVYYGGVDYDLFYPNGAHKENFVFSVGSLTPLKGFDFIISALATIPKKIRPPFVIACNFENPPEKNYLVNLANKMDVDLQIKSNISDLELVNLYNRAKLTVYAPIREPFGLVAIESMACGTPVVGVSEGGLVETIQHGKTGLLTKRNAMEFGTAVQNLLADPEKLHNFGLIGRQTVLEKWTWKVSANTVGNYFQEVVENSQRKRK